jgi:hypothetical protein
VRLAARTSGQNAVERTAELLEQSGATRGGLRGDSPAGMRDRKEP